MSCLHEIYLSIYVRTLEHSAAWDSKLTLFSSSHHRSISSRNEKHPQTKARFAKSVGETDLATSPLHISVCLCSGEHQTFLFTTPFWSVEQNVANHRHPLISGTLLIGHGVQASQNSLAAQCLHLHTGETSHCNEYRHNVNKTFIVPFRELHWF